MKMDKLINGLKAAGEPTRMRLLVVLSRAELTVSELTRILGQSQPRISRHLKLLCEAELLDRFQEGAWVFYRLAKSANGHAPNASVSADSLASLVLAQLDMDDPAILGDMQRLDQVREARRQEAADYFAAAAGEWEDLRSLHVPEQEVEAAMQALVGEGTIDTFLDIGTGTGRMLEIFGGRARSGLGVDLSHEMLAIARAKIEEAGLEHCQVRQGDLFALDRARANQTPADLVTLHQVLHYLPDPALAIAQAAGELGAGGRLLIADFAPHDVEQLREVHSHRRLGFADDEVKKWMEAAGLSDIVIKHLPPPDGSEKKLTVTLWMATANGTEKRRAS